MHVIQLLITFFYVEVTIRSDDCFSSPTEPLTISLKNLNNFVNFIKTTR